MLSRDALNDAGRRVRKLTFSRHFDTRPLADKLFVKHFRELTHFGVNLILTEALYGYITSVFLVQGFNRLK